MGRRKIEILPITNERNRSVTFLKRKNGLFKKAYELGVLCSVDVAVIIFEERPGQHVKLFQYSSSDIHDIVQRHVRHDGEKDTKGPHDFSGNRGTKIEDEDEGEDEDEDDILDSRASKRRRDGKVKGPQSSVAGDITEYPSPNGFRDPYSSNNSGLGSGTVGSSTAALPISNHRSVPFAGSGSSSDRHHSHVHGSNSSGSGLHLTRSARRPSPSDDVRSGVVGNSYYSGGQASRGGQHFNREAGYPHGHSHHAPPPNPPYQSISHSSRSTASRPSQSGQRLFWQGASDGYIGGVVGGVASEFGAGRSRGEDMFAPSLDINDPSRFGGGGGGGHHHMQPQGQPHSQAGQQPAHGGLDWPVHSASADGGVQSPSGPNPITSSTSASSGSVGPGGTGDWLDFLSRSKHSSGPVGGTSAGIGRESMSWERGSGPGPGGSGFGGGPGSGGGGVDRDMMDMFSSAAAHGRAGSATSVDGGAGQMVMGISDRSRGGVKSEDNIGVGASLRGTGGGILESPVSVSMNGKG